MILFSPAASNQFSVESDDLDFPATLRRIETLMEAQKITDACQLCFDVTQQAVDALDSMEETIELDMQNPDNKALIEIMVKCGFDHYFIADYELGAAILEEVLELDPEDHCGATQIVAFCYAGLEEWEAMQETIDMGALQLNELKFLAAFSEIAQNNKYTVHEPLKTEVEDPESELNHLVEPLKNTHQMVIDRLLA